MLRVDREFERPLQITAMQTDGTLKRTRSRSQAGIVKRSP
jgi:hypothetical protein